MTHAEFMERFKDEPGPERRRVELAYILAKDAHRSQTRMDGERYFEHPRRVALILVDELGIRDLDMICAGLLHDTIEDTKYIDVAFIGQFFGTIVADYVRRLTKPNDYKTNPAHKELYWESIAQHGDVVIVKACDRLDNLRSMVKTNNNFKRKQATETKERVLPMLEQLVKTDWLSPQAQQLITTIRGQLAAYGLL